MMLEKSTILSQRKIDGEYFVTEYMPASELFRRDWPRSSYEIVLVEPGPRSSWAVVRYKLRPGTVVPMTLGRVPRGGADQRTIVGWAMIGAVLYGLWGCWGLLQSDHPTVATPHRDMYILGTERH